ncbi:hypothetical protein TNCV_3221461 [Trichonephila clavipes]|nr:hypothetical protein TNCV_3221461 [Trichonephila clavipes]
MPLPVTSCVQGTSYTRLSLKQNSDCLVVHRGHQKPANESAPAHITPVQGQGALGRVPERPSGLEEGRTELSNAPSSHHESFYEGLGLTSLKGLYPAEQEDLKVSRRGVRPEWEPPYMDREGSGTHEHRSVQAATPRVLRRKTVAHKPKRVVSCRAGGPKRVVSRRERATVRGPRLRLF